MVITGNNYLCLYPRGILSGEVDSTEYYLTWHDSPSCAHAESVALISSTIEPQNLRMIISKLVAGRRLDIFCNLSVLSVELHTLFLSRLIICLSSVCCRSYPPEHVFSKVQRLSPYTAISACCHLEVVVCYLLSKLSSCFFHSLKCIAYEVCRKICAWCLVFVCCIFE